MYLTNFTMMNEKNVSSLQEYSAMGPFSNCVTPEGWGYGDFCYELLRKFRGGIGGHSSFVM